MDPIAPDRRGRLADGREILYFDDVGSIHAAPPADPRHLPPRGAPAELRHDRLVDEPVLIASHRQDRTHLPAADACPLCPSRGDAETEVPARAYDVAAFENRFPSLPAGAPGRGPAGRSEVVCWSSDHAASFATLPTERLRTIGRALVQRSVELGALPGVSHVLPFENRGVEIGVTLHHPHGQVYAYPFIPPRIERLERVAGEHHVGTGRCLGCELLADELSDDRRILLRTDAAVAYVPHAARWPFEIHLVPRRHVPDIAALSAPERDEIVRLQADLLGRLDTLFAQPAPYMAGWLQAPTGEGRDLLHLRLQVVSPRRAANKLKYLAGSESLAGGWINDVRPEEAATRLRDAAR